MAVERLDRRTHILAYNPIKRLNTRHTFWPITLLLAGCGTDSSSGKTQIRFATWDKAEDVDRQQTLVDQFNESHDDIEVTLEAYGSDFDTKISAGMGSNDTPDVMYMWNYPSYADGLEPLDS